MAHRLIVLGKTEYNILGETDPRILEISVGVVATQVTAEHVNPSTALSHMRLPCRLAAPWPDGYEPLSGPEYQPIAQSAA